MTNILQLLHAKIDEYKNAPVTTEYDELCKLDYHLHDLKTFYKIQAVNDIIQAIQDTGSCEFIFADYDDFKQTANIQCTKCHKYFNEDYNLHIRDWSYCPHCGLKITHRKGGGK